jgi:uncharacterized membrane protein
LFLFTASGHFVQTATMVQMLPPWVPAREALVYVTGVIEVAVAIGFFVPPWRPLARCAGAAMLVAFSPANVYAAIHHVPMGGHAWGPVYLLVRAPLQVILLAWVGYFVCARLKAARRAARQASSDSSLPSLGIAAPSCVGTMRPLVEGLRRLQAPAEDVAQLAQ